MVIWYSLCCLCCNFRTLDKGYFTFREITCITFPYIILGYLWASMFSPICTSYCDAYSVYIRVGLVSCFSFIIILDNSLIYFVGDYVVTAGRWTLSSPVSMLHTLGYLGLDVTVSLPNITGVACGSCSYLFTRCFCCFWTFLHMTVVEILASCWDGTFLLYLMLKIITLALG